MIPLVLAVLLAAADSVPAPRSHAALDYGFQSFTRDRTTWHSAGARVGRRFEHGTLIGELVAARRFDLNDRGVALDAYRTLWRRAYGNVRTQVVPSAHVLPRLDVAAELFQGVPGGVELSAGYRRMQFRGAQASIFSGGVGLYTGNWYLRLKGLVVPRAGKTGVSTGLGVRRYFATVDDLLDVQAGLGEELITLGASAAGPLVEVRKNRFAALRYQRSLTPGLAVRIGATYNGTDGLPDRRGLEAGVTVRW